MGRGFWWISTGIMLVLFLPLGLILLAVTILKEINGSFDKPEKEEKKKIVKNFKEKEYADYILRENK